MKNIVVRKYTITDFELWNDFVAKAKNSSFLFHRNFMEYHADRFQDFSLLVFSSKKLVAILPANIVDKEVFSHQGLSYGGLIINKKIRILDYVAVFKAILVRLNENDVRYFTIKLLPKIYNKSLADEIDLVTFLLRAKLLRSDSYLVLEDNLNYKTNRNRKRALNTAIDFEVKHETNFDDFWNSILTPNLQQRFQAKPVHSLEEITQLAAKFPNQIQLFNVYNDNVLKAGVVLFEMENVIHFQYSSGASDRNEIPALDYLFDWIVKKYKSKKYISFGCASENNGLELNKGLAYWKESFGATATVQNYIQIETANFELLDTFLND